MTSGPQLRVTLTSRRPTSCVAASPMHEHSDPINSHPTSGHGGTSGECFCSEVWQLGPSQRNKSCVRAAASRFGKSSFSGWASPPEQVSDGVRPIMGVRPQRWRPLVSSTAGRPPKRVGRTSSHGWCPPNRESHPWADARPLGVSLPCGYSSLPSSMTPSINFCVAMLNLSETENGGRVMTSSTQTARAGIPDSTLSEP